MQPDIVYMPIITFFGNMVKISIRIAAHVNRNYFGPNLNKELTRFSVYFLICKLVSYVIKNRMRIKNADKIFIYCLWGLFFVKLKYRWMDNL